MVQASGGNYKLKQMKLVIEVSDFPRNHDDIRGRVVLVACFGGPSHVYIYIYTNMYTLAKKYAGAVSSRSLAKMYRYTQILAFFITSAVRKAFCSAACARVVTRPVCPQGPLAVLTVVTEWARNL